MVHIFPESVETSNYKTSVSKVVEVSNTNSWWNNQFLKSMHKPQFHSFRGITEIGNETFKATKILNWISNQENYEN